MVEDEPTFEDLLECVFGVTEADAEVLGHLLADERKTAEELARELGRDRSTINSRLDDLRERGLVVRHRNLLGGSGIAYEYESVSPERMADACTGRWTSGRRSCTTRSTTGWSNSPSGDRSVGRRR